MAEGLGRFGEMELPREAVMGIGQLAPTSGVVNGGRSGGEIKKIPFDPGLADRIGFLEAETVQGVGGIEIDGPGRDLGRSVQGSQEGVAQPSGVPVRDVVPLEVINLVEAFAAVLPAGEVVFFSGRERHL